jgi:hypothetical protein
MTEHISDAAANSDDYAVWNVQRGVLPLHHRPSRRMRPVMQR